MAIRDEIRVASLMHDIGKVYNSESPYPFSFNFNICSSNYHPLYGAYIFKTELGGILGDVGINPDTVYELIVHHHTSEKKVDKRNHQYLFNRISSKNRLYCSLVILADVCSAVLTREKLKYPEFRCIKADGAKLIGDRYDECALECLSMHLMDINKQRLYNANELFNAFLDTMYLFTNNYCSAGRNSSTLFMHSYTSAIISEVVYDVLRRKGKLRSFDYKNAVKAMSNFDRNAVTIPDNIFLLANKLNEGCDLNFYVSLDDNRRNKYTNRCLGFFHKIKPEFHDEFKSFFRDQFIDYLMNAGLNGFDKNEDN